MKPHPPATKVLLVEDDPSVHQALAGVLVSNGYEVIHGFDGTDAMREALAGDDIGIVLLDLNLAYVSGWDVVEPLTRLRPLLPIVVITARPNQFELASAAGVAALMEKPLDFPLLLAAMREILAESANERLARLNGSRPLPRLLAWRN